MTYLDSAVCEQRGTRSFSHRENEGLFTPPSKHEAGSPKIPFSGPPMTLFFHVQKLEKPEYCNDGMNIIGKEIRR
jgi:hypothetical protein